MRIERIEGEVMAVNSFLVHGPEGVVVVDGQLTVSDAEKVQQAVRSTGRPLAGVLLTHPHPDHYAGAGVVAAEGEPIIATKAVDAVIRADDAAKDSLVGPMMGDQWPTERRFPDQLLESGETVELAGLAFEVHETGPGESHMDCLWWLDDRTVFAGDIAYHDMHAYLADGHADAWRSTLAQLERELHDDVVLHLGHGASAGRSVLSAQRRYVDAFVEAVSRCSHLRPEERRAQVVERMRPLATDERLLFLMELSIEPVHDALAAS